MQRDLEFLNGASRDFALVFIHNERNAILRQALRAMREGRKQTMEELLRRDRELRQAQWAIEAMPGPTVEATSGK